MSTKFEIGGIIPALVTPFHQDESIDEPALRAHVRRMLDAGVHAVFAGGTNGEFFALSTQERTRVTAVVVDEVAGRVPVYAGTGAVTTREAIELSKAAEGAGADALSVITPYFAQASQDELVRHYLAVAEAVSVPVVLYNIPARTGNALAPQTVARLADVDNIAGVKDSSGNFDTILQYIEGTRDKDFAVLCGNDALILWSLLAGGTGSITGVSNIYPDTMVGIYEAWRRGDLEQARTFQDSIRPIRNCLALGNPNTIVKKAVTVRGFDVGPCRAPFNQVSEEAVQKLTETIAADEARGMS